MSAVDFFWLFVSLVLLVTAPLNKSKKDFHCTYPPEKTGKFSFGKLTFTSVDQVSLVEARVVVLSL